LAVLAVVALAACGKPSSETAVAKPPDERKLLNACLLLTPEEADEAAGHAVDMLASPLDTTIGVDTVKCSYGVLGPPLRLVSIEVRRLKSPTRHAPLRAARPPCGGWRSAREPVAALGEAAFWAGGWRSSSALRGDLPCWWR
jgi:hypothetical protein